MAYSTRLFSSRFLFSTTTTVLRTGYPAATLSLSKRCNTKASPNLHRASVTITYVTKEGERITVNGKEGDSLLDVANDNHLEFPGFGVCGGTLSCSTCHLIIREEDYKKLQIPPKEEELDMLDLSCCHTHTSRLGCQVRVTRDLDGIVAHLPEITNEPLN